MPSTYFTPAKVERHTLGRADLLNNNFNAIDEAFGKLPDPAALAQGRATYVVGGGVVNAYTAALSPAIPGYVEGLTIKVKLPFSNTGPSTLNVNGRGARAIKRPDGTDPTPGALPGAPGIVELVYNGNQFILTSSVLIDVTNAANAGAAAVSAAAAAAGYAVNADADANVAAAAASSAASSATAANTSASTANTRATTATTKATEAAASATAAANSATAVAGYASTASNASSEATAKATAADNSAKAADASAKSAAASVDAIPARQSSTYDDTVGRLATVGAFGIGGPLKVAGNISGSGVATWAPLGLSAWQYVESSNSSNGPAYASRGLLIMTRRADGGGDTQTFIVEATNNPDLCPVGAIFTRSRVTGSWPSWLPNFGSNSNGSWIKRADGTMTCTLVQNLDSDAWDASAGSLYNRATDLTWTFPQEFSDVPRATAHTRRATSGGVSGVTTRVPSATQVNYRPWSSGALTASNNKDVILVADGRWKP